MRATRIELVVFDKKLASIRQRKCIRFVADLFDKYMYMSFDKNDKNDRIAMQPLFKFLAKE